MYAPPMPSTNVSCGNDLTSDTVTTSGSDVTDCTGEDGKDCTGIFSDSVISVACHGGGCIVHPG